MRLSTALCHLCLPILVAGLTFAAQGQTAVVRDPEALKILTGASSSLSKTSVINDVTLDGTAQYTVGSDNESPTVVLQASGNLKSAVTLALGSGVRQEIRNSYQGIWSVAGERHTMAIHNAVTPAAWFFPHLLIAGFLQNASYSVAYIGQEQRSGTAVHHLEISGCPGLASAAEFPLSLTTVELYVDTGTLLPSELTFNLHPDRDAIKNLPVGILFQNYEPSGGVLIPMHITKLFLDTVLLDITVSKATINAGIADSSFSTLP